MGDRLEIGVRLFPVCGQCHKTLHKARHWLKDKGDPVLGNRNTDEAVTRLQAGFKKLTEG